MTNTAHANELSAVAGLRPSHSADPAVAGLRPSHSADSAVAGLRPSHPADLAVAGLRPSHSADRRSPEEQATADTNLLLARAREFAREQPAADGDDGTSIQVLEFGLSDEIHAFELAYVREVGKLVELTPLPGVPDHILGVTCVHGQIIAVLDLRKIFGLPERGLSNSRQAIILESVNMEFGVLAERIAGVRRLPLAELQPSLPTLTDTRAAYLKGITPDGTVVLSAAKLLADQQLVVQQNG